MKVITTFLFSILIVFTSFAQNSLSLDFNKYEKIEGISKVDLNKKYGIISKSNQAVFRNDSIKGESLLSHYISLATVSNGNLVYLLKLTDLKRNTYVVVDQFYFQSNLKRLYFNTLGCDSLGDKALGNVFAIQGGNSSDTEFIKHFFVDHKNDKFKELGPDAKYCEFDEPMHTIRQDNNHL